MPLPSGHRLGPYEITGHLGSGAFGPARPEQCDVKYRFHLGAYEYGWFRTAALR